MPTTAEQHAEDYGYQLAFLKSDKELYSVFQKAMSGKWDSTRFVAAVKETKWYKTHGEAYRQGVALKKTDPATYMQRFNSQLASVGQLAATMGASMPTLKMRQIAEQSVLLGWNDDQIRNVLSQHIKHGSREGEAGQVAQAIKEAGYRNGVNLSERFITGWQRKFAAGEATMERIEQGIRTTYGKRLAPGFAQELDAGMDLYDIAAPYMQSMARTLELNPSDIDLFDPTIRRAMGSSTDKDGKPGSTSLWEFELSLRQDKRFMKTKTAQDQVMAVGNKILQDFGLKGD